MIGTNTALSVFLDTNVLVYAYDNDAGSRHERAVQLIEELRRTMQVVVSAQVLNEFYSAITRPTRPMALTHGEATQIIREIAAAWEVVPLTPETTLRALDGMPQHGLSFWDALIWAAATESGIPVIYTEDFQDGREIDGVRFVNPFQASR